MSPMGIHVVVEYRDHQRGFYPVPAGQSWRLDTAARCIVIGTGVPRTYVPLDSVLSFNVEECGDGPR